MHGLPGSSLSQRLHGRAAFDNCIPSCRLLMNARRFTLRPESPRMVEAILRCIGGRAGLAVVDGAHLLCRASRPCVILAKERTRSVGDEPGGRGSERVRLFAVPGRTPIAHRGRVLAEPGSQARTPPSLTTFACPLKGDGRRRDEAGGVVAYDGAMGEAGESLGIGVIFSK